MKKKQHIYLGLAILACWLFLGIAFSVGRLKQLTTVKEKTLTVNQVDNRGAEEIAIPFSLKAVSTFLLQ